MLDIPSLPGVLCAELYCLRTNVFKFRALKWVVQDTLADDGSKVFVNAQMAAKDLCEHVPSSKMKASIAVVLREEGYVVTFQ